MKKLNEKEWKPIQIVKLFDDISAGKISNASKFEKSDIGEIEYVAATNRNNGCLYFLKDSGSLQKKIQSGNCIGFIKDGNGSAGYSIYKFENFTSTVNVIYGYANWLNLNNGLFFVASQDKIKEKYSHGYKRNLSHLKGDKVMLPVTDQGEPDYRYMEEYTKSKRKEFISRYKAFVKKQMEGLEYKKIPSLEEKEWNHFLIPEIFPKIQRGKRFKKADHESGNIPYVSSTALNNGIDGYVKKNDGTRVFDDCISLANSGSVGAVFYEPFKYVGSDHVTCLKRSNTSQYIYLFLVTQIEKQGSNFNFNREINDARIKKMQVMLPVTDQGEPDYEYMEQYTKNIMLKKYTQYLSFLKRIF